MATNNQQVAPTAKGVMDIIQNTPIADIPELEFVKNKYITNFNTCNPNADGELMYHRNLVFLKMALNSFKTREGTQVTLDPFSVYACITTMAVDGLSVAPADEEVYLYHKDGKLFMQKQAGAHVRRLINSGQILSVKKVDLVYDGDEFEVEDDYVTVHKKRYKSDTIIAGYIKFLLPNGDEKHFDYRRSDWESWRSHSPLPFSENWRYLPPENKNDKEFKPFQPKPGFLKTKIISHACQEKSWTPGRRPVAIEIYSNVYRELQEGEEAPEYVTKQITPGEIPPITPHETVTEAAAPTAKQPKVTTNDENSFATQPATKPTTGVIHQDEAF